MSIWKMCQAYLQEQRQKGQIIVFTAVLLPFIIAMCGLTVDFGNMYVHKSKLQNAADAAAIAGAYAYADNKESPSAHPKADAAADKSINTNHPNFSNLTMEYKAREANSNKYFRVVLTEEVPVYFLRFFNVGDTADVDAEAVAAIETSNGGGTTGGGNSIFSNLFSFGEGGFTSTNNGQNPGHPENSIDYNNVATYDGNVVNVGPIEGTSDYRHEVLLTSKTREEVKNGNIITTQNAIDKQDIDGITGYYTKATTDKTKSLDEQSEAIKAKALDKDTGITIEYMNGIDVSNYLGQAKGKDYICNNTRNFELIIDENYYKNNKNNNNPLYIVVTNDGDCKLTPKASYQKAYETSRPIVFVYTGTGKIQIDNNGENFFRGIIYAPKGTVAINDNHLTFHGSIAAKTISLGSVGYYSWEAIIPGTSDAGSGSSGTGTTSIGLVSPPSNISWD